MSLEPRDFTVTDQWAADAATVIPPTPASGHPYRNPNVTAAAIRAGQFYDTVADSAVWNQLLFQISGMVKETETYGWPRWSPMTDYVGGYASKCTGGDGIPYLAKKPSGPGTPDGFKIPGAEPDYWISLPDWIAESLNIKGGIPHWSAADCYSPLPHIVWDDDRMLYVATAPSGPCVAAGAKKPTTSPEYWMSLPDWLMQWITIPDAEMGIPKWVGGKVWTHPQIVWDQDSDGWDLWISLQTSGTTGVGDKRPTTTTGYWMRLAEWVRSKSTPITAVTFYVRSDGDDNNSGMVNSASGAFRTAQGAVNAYSSRFNPSPYQVSFIFGTSGDFGTLNFSASTISTQGVLFKGISSAVIPRLVNTYNGGNDINFAFSNSSGSAALENIELSTTSNVSSGLTYCTALSAGGGTVRLHDNVTLSANGSYSGKYLIQAFSGGHVDIDGSISMTGSTGRAISCDSNSLVQVYPSVTNRTINITNLSCSHCFLFGNMGKFAVHGPVSFTGTPSSIVRKYVLYDWSVCDTGGLGENFFPGTAAGIKENSIYR